MSAIILAVRRQDSGDRIQETGDYFLFILPTSPLPHFPIPFKQDLVLLLKGSFLLTD